jgi:hypothetical protein
MRIDETREKRFASQINLRSIRFRRRDAARIVHKYALLGDELAVLV